MKKNNSSKKSSIDSSEDYSKSIIGLYEMLAQAQQNLIDKDRNVSDHGSLNLPSSSRSDE